MNNCGDCDLCCKLLETHGVPSPIGTYCQHCDKGCKIYNDRPQECREYQCMWTQMPEQFARIEMRPDNSGIIFDRQDGMVISARVDTDWTMTGLIHGQINSFVNEGFSVIVFRGNEHKIFLTNGHTEEYVKEIVNGKSKLYT